MIDNAIKTMFICIRAEVGFDHIADLIAKRLVEKWVVNISWNLKYPSGKIRNVV